MNKNDFVVKIVFLPEYLCLFVKYYSCCVFFFIRRFRISEKKAKFARIVEKNIKIKTSRRFNLNDKAF